MTDNLAPRFEFERVLKHMFGSTRKAVLIHGLALLTLFGMFTDALSNLASQFNLLSSEASKEPFKLGFDALIIVAFPAYFVWLWRRTRRTSIWETPHVIANSPPAQMRGLVLFLSPPGRDLLLIQELLDGTKKGRLKDEQLHQGFAGPWRMAIEAIACHMPRLQYVVVIGSATLDTRVGAQEGTAHRVPRFVELIHALEGGESLCIESLSESMAKVPGGDAWAERWSDGVNFEDVHALLEAIEAAYQALQSRGLAGYEIGVDVTGGQKTTTIAGAIATLAIGRHCQYVSTHDHTVKSFDVTYFE